MLKPTLLHDQYLKLAVTKIGANGEQQPFTYLIYILNVIDNTTFQVFAYY